MRVAFLLAGLLVFAALVKAQNDCPNKCSDHGSCVRGSCRCDSNYEGEDCSLKVVGVQNGEVARDSVERSDWLYYKFHNQHSQTTMVWWLNRTGTGDCDLYIQRGEIPGRTNFMARNISVSEEQIVVLTDKPQGYYYAGVYGYRGCSFRLSATVEGECLGDCNGNGECQHGECFCNDGYSGENCETYTETLVPGRPVDKALARAKWDYYVFTAEQVVEELAWIMAKVTESEDRDCDIYLLKGERPTMWHWDLANVTTHQVTYINQTDVIVGETYYLGVYGYLGCDYNLRLEMTIPANPGECPNQCSNHAESCLENICHCSEGYTGDQCESYTPGLEYDHEMTGYVGESAWNYYHVVGDVSEDITVSMTSQTGDCDLYVKANENPTRFDYQYSNILATPELSINIHEPQGSDWYIGIFGWTECDYSLTVHTSFECNCDEHGHCDDPSPQCICDGGWAGDDCSVPVKIIHSAVPQTGKVIEPAVWHYYKLRVRGSSAVSLTLTEKNTQGLVWLFVSHSDYPTLSVHDFEEKSTGKVHQITYVTQEQQDRDVFIGVYGSPIEPYSVEDWEYDLVVWSAGF